MGMFDDLKISSIHLPERIKVYETGWQTKSLECNLDFLIIDEEGNLFKITYGEQPQIKIPVLHTGEVRFYQSIKDEWVEFVAFFVNGKMQGLHLLI
jgi:hypothetical protein